MRVGSRLATGDSRLSEICYLAITCDDCGRQNWWTRADLDSAERCGFKSLSSLGDTLRCIYCAERGGGGRNLSVRAAIEECE